VIDIVFAVWDFTSTENTHKKSKRKIKLKQSKCRENSTDGAEKIKH